MVVGATSWGCTLATCVDRAGNDAVVLCRTDAEAAQLSAAREHRRLLPGIPLPDGLTFTADPRGTPPGVIIWATPSQRLRQNLRDVLPNLTPGDTVHASAAKGLEKGSHLRMSEVLEQELSLAGRDGRVGAISGPNIAREVARGLPATTVVASQNAHDRERLQQALNSESFRVYTNEDLIGVELGGALKNVIAIAVGTAVGLDIGDNARAALMTRGLSEIARLGVALGAEPATFAGLAGLGDLLATASSPRSRNRTLGEKIGGGMTLSDAMADNPHVVEGVETTRVVLEVAEALGVDMPIARVVSQVLFENLEPREAIRVLMQRAPTVEG
ncbi:MAG: NAD(P)-dependent glycerol-3-phosphate dehydrogenase [Chloroflexota bacterium]|nr:NAD(P)-dependent glycerol-3-phosphate dehydrogenase [Chloroflexota bacterium]MDE2894549.1 NAD(P)-dependent glycerol-3-phosphate dehydrogenase [Chloroflexota bacterium]